MLGPDARHRHVRNIPTQLSRQLARRPVRRSVRRRVLGGTGQDSRFYPVCDPVALTAAVPSEQSGQPICRKALLPTTDVTVATVQLGADFGPRQAVSEQQNQPRMRAASARPFLAPACRCSSIRSPLVSIIASSMDTMILLN